MLKEFVSKNYLITILIIGVVFRLTLFFISPPNNAYDDHLEVIKIYSETFNRPAPFKCWECYQPPAYYLISGTIYKSLLFFGTANGLAWKIVQLINPLLSIGVLILFLKILLTFKLSNWQRILYFSFVAVFPRDIFTAVMIGNDYLLIFCSVAAFYYYIKFIKSKPINEKSSKKYFLLLCFFAALASLTKQHGLLLLAFPGYIVFNTFIQRKLSSHKILLSIFSLTVIISLSDEIWKLNQTGEFLVSNQHYFDYAEGQFPGDIEQIEFDTFRVFKLYKEPFITENTAASFPTEIFARSFFDYEWRFLSPKFTSAHLVGKIGYSLGIIWVLYFLLSTIFGLKNQLNKKKTDYFKLAYFVPVLIGIMFLIVPIIQTFRFPYFSSMKTMFILPGVIILLAMHSLLIKEIKFSSKGVITLSTLNLLYGILLVITIGVLLKESLAHLHGPLWNLPN